MNSQPLVYALLFVTPLAAEALPAFRKQVAPGLLRLVDVGSDLRSNKSEQLWTRSLRACVELSGPELLYFVWGNYFWRHIYQKSLYYDSWANCPRWRHNYIRQRFNKCCVHCEDARRYR